MPTAENFISILNAGVDFEKRELYLYGEIDMNSSYRFITALNILDSTEGDIIVVMNTVGGEETSGYAVYDALMMTKNKVIVKGFGIVASISAAIFQAGDERLLSPNCEYLVHNGILMGGLGEAPEQDTIVAAAARIIEASKLYYQILAQRSNKTLTEIENICRTETYFTALEAVKYGFADRVISYTKKTKKIKKR